MSEDLEGDATQDIEIEKPKKKKPIKIRVALFYDGTLNNRINVEEREKNSDIYKKNTKKNGPNSYDNGRTNIAIMEPHIEDLGDLYKDYNIVCKQYIAGQGALSLKKDTFRGYALGGGESGVADRADEGITAAVNVIMSHDDFEFEEHYIEKLTIDVFGFSRGAATARYAIHVIHEGRGALLQEGNNEAAYEWKPLHTRLINRGCTIERKAVEVCFAGLFDTVLSYYGSQYFKFTSNVLEKKAVARAKKALHLTAADEHRSDFRLHNISSAKSNNGEEYYLPGVHSDVGGSYNQASEKEIEAETEESKKVYMKTSDEGLVIKEGMITSETLIINEGDPERMEKDRKDLITQGWYKSNQIKIKHTAWDEDLVDIPTESILTVQREAIRSAYCNIPLKIMAKYARDPSVKLKLNSKLERRANRILEPEADLIELESIIEKYIASSKNSTAEDWIGDNAKLNNSKLKKIRNRHFHFSSKPGIGYSPNFEWDEAAWKFRRIRFVYDA